jgi:hypothetical protein
MLKGSEWLGFLPRDSGPFGVCGGVGNDLFVPPGWKGDVPAGMTRIGGAHLHHLGAGGCRPTDRRTTTNVHKVQDGLKLAAGGLGETPVAVGRRLGRTPEPLGRLVSGHEAPGFAEPHGALPPNP